MFPSAQRRDVQRSGIPPGEFLCDRPSGGALALRVKGNGDALLLALSGLPEPLTTTRALHRLSSSAEGSAPGRVRGFRPGERRPLAAATTGVGGPCTRSTRLPDPETVPCRRVVHMLMANNLNICDECTNDYKDNAGISLRDATWTAIHIVRCAVCQESEC
jgi:hypothetical protein